MKENRQEMGHGERRAAEMKKDKKREKRKMRREVLQKKIFL